jgi:hypothetical protein
MELAIVDGASDFLKQGDLWQSVTDITFVPSKIVYHNTDRERRVTCRVGL